MERLNERIETARRAVETLGELESERYSKIVRDAAIQRFEYSFEATWKAAQHYLRYIEGLEIGSPKGVLRACFQMGLLNEDQARQSLAMVDDRNLTSHTYNESLAMEIYAKISGHRKLMSNLLDAMRTRYVTTSGRDVFLPSS